MFWGFCEALNFVEEFRKIAPKNALPASLDILLFGSGDPRHILATAASFWQHPQLNVNFYVVEGCAELIARHMLLLAIAFEDPEQLSVKAKTHLFMDLYGNTLIRPFSNAYLNSKAKVLTNIITDPDYAQKYAPIFDYEALKYKERDQLENVFRFWTNSQDHVFNIARYWDDRTRVQLGVRYDHRHGAFDWDLQMRLRENGARQICTQEYKHWRETGIAFTFPEYEQSDPNKTFAVGLVRQGKTFLHRGSVGDNMTGPFISFGQRCPEEALTREKHGVNDFRSTDITERNIMQIMYELKQKQPYQLELKDIHRYGSHKLDNGKNLNKHEPRSEILEATRYDSPMVECDKLKIFFLSVDDVLRMQDNTRFTAKFDVVFVASNYFRLLKNEFSTNWKDDCLLCFETRQLTIFSKEEIAEHNEAIKIYAQKTSLQAVSNFAINKKYSVHLYKHVRNE